MKPYHGTWTEITKACAPVYPSDFSNLFLTLLLEWSFKDTNYSPAWNLAQHSREKGKFLSTHDALWSGSHQSSFIFH